MIEMGKKYQTKDGRPVRILCVDGPGDEPVIGIVEGQEDPDTWTANGEWFKNTRSDAWNLVPVPTKHEGWCLVDTGAPSYATRAEAERAFAMGVYTIGRGLDDERYRVAHVTWED